MEKNHKNTSSIITLEFMLEAKSDKHFHQDIELIYVLSGKLETFIEEEVFLMGKDDLVVINTDKEHYFIDIDDAFVACLTISYAKLSALLEQEYILFECNSVIDKGNDYKKIKAIIQNIFNQSIYGLPSNKILLNSLYYQFLNMLTNQFLVIKKDMGLEFIKHRHDDRINEISHYIRLNYNRDIGLNDLANKLYLSDAYLSKYIKKQFGVSFTRLLNTERLNQAVSDLTYTNLPIIKIAMENGFANVTTFNRAFKERYNTTPSLFRQRLYHKNEIDIEKQIQKQKLVKEKMEAYFEGVSAKYPAGDKYAQDIAVDANFKSDKLLNNNWCELINIGAAADLLMSNFQEHLLYLKRKLNYKYVRFWDIYSKEMLINIHADNGKYNFGKLDYILEFLVANQIKPYIELGFKPIRILKNVHVALKADEQKERFADDEKMCDFFSALTRHLINRFGAEEIETWYFEVWLESEEKYLELEYNNYAFTEQQIDSYLKTFSLIAGTIRKYLPSVHIGGAGLGAAGKLKKLNDILRKWAEMEEQPNFLSLNIYPYIGDIEQSCKTVKMVTDDHFVLNAIKRVKELLNEIAFSVPELHVTEFNLALSSRNAFNDHYGKGAYLMKTIMECIDQTDVLGYWIGSDIFSDFNDTNEFLFGGPGLLTKQGIPKPSFYAIEMLNLLQKFLLDKGENHIITASGHHMWRMVCHNYKKLNYNFYLTPEDEIRYEEISSMFEDNHQLKIRFKMKNLENGIYMVKTSYINQNTGSIQDEWARMDKESDLDIEEIEYLKRITTPQRAMKKYLVNNHMLEFEVNLEPNEIRNVYILLKQ